MIEKILTFQQIVDSRFINNDLLLELNKINKNIIDEINKLDGIYVKFDNSYKIDFKECTQYRQNYFIKKNNKKITWNNVYKTINNIKFAHYKFINLDFNDIN